MGARQPGTGYVVSIHQRSRTQCGRGAARGDWANVRSARAVRQALRASGRYLLARGEIRTLPAAAGWFEIELFGGPPNAMVAVHIGGRIAVELKLDALGHGVCHLDSWHSPASDVRVTHGRRSVVSGRYPSRVRMPVS